MFRFRISPFRFSPTLLLAMLVAPLWLNAQQYNLQTFSLEQGLAQSGVYAIAEDRNGKLWFGTEGGGVSRFDGRSFTTFNKTDGLSGNIVRAVLQDSKGYLWFGTQDGGICRYNGRVFETMGSEEGLERLHIRSILEDAEGRIWFGTYGAGVVIYDGKTFERMDVSDGLPHNTVRTMHLDREGHVWLGTDDGALMVDGTNLHLYSANDGLPHSKILHITEDHAGNVWFGTSGGASRFDGKEFFNITTRQGLIHKRVKSVLHDQWGNVWFGTRNGLCKISSNDLEAGNWNFTYISEREGLSSSRIRTIFEDGSGTIWFGTYFGGACQYIDGRFVHLTEETGLSNQIVSAMYADPWGAVWLGTHGNGLCRYEREFMACQDTEFGLPGNVITAVTEEENGNLWVGTEDSGIGVFNAGEWVNFSEDDGLSSNQVNALMHGKDGQLWIGTNKGITVMDWNGTGEPVFSYFAREDGLVDETIYALAQDSKGNVWLGCDSGLAQIELQYSPPRVTYYGMEYGLFSDMTVSVTIDQNDHVWFGTNESGIGRYDGDFFTTWTAREGLSSSQVRSMIFAGPDTLWVGTLKGINKVVLDENGMVASIRSFDQNDGFWGIECYRNAICAMPGGSIWFGTIRGATRYNPHEDHPNPNPPKLHISELDLFFDPNGWQAFADSIVPFDNLPHDLVLPHDQNHLTFAYTGIDMKVPEKVLYRFQLEGYDPEWSPENTRKEITYSHLPPGSYTFKVWASNSDGIWVDEPTTFSFRIKPPFWQTWTFIIVSSVLTALIVYLSITWRIRTLKRKNERLEAIVRERTLDLRLEKEKSDELLLNILPEETAEELKDKGYAETRDYESVTVLFSDFKGFTALAEKLGPQELVRELSATFVAFDQITEDCHVEKIKTIGDAYMAAGGLPEKNATHAVDTVLAALRMIAFMHQFNAEREANNQPAWQIRLGVHTGHIIAGVVGKRKFAYDIWGDTVNIAARMESSGEPGKLNISESTYSLVKEVFECSHRGKIQAKGKGEIDMYFVERLKPAYSKDENGLEPNEALTSWLKQQTLSTEES